jgi:hypothetical protein
MNVTQHQVEKYSLGRDFSKREVPHFALHGEEVKCCSRCGKVRPLARFQSHRLTWDGLTQACEDCCGPDGLDVGAATDRWRMSDAPAVRRQRSPEENRLSAQRGAALAGEARRKGGSR